MAASKTATTTTTTTTTTTVSDGVLRAQLAEQVERYEEMASIMLSVVRQRDQELSVLERNLLAIAYKNVSGERRAIYRKLLRIERDALLAHGAGKTDETSVHDRTARLAREYRNDVETQLEDVCRELLGLLSEHVLPIANAELASRVPLLLSNARCYRDRGFESMEEDLEHQLFQLYKENVLTSAENCEALVFYYKMIGDYHRFVAELSLEDDGKREAEAEDALAAYVVASSIARTQLTPTHPVRLGLALNFSVFYYEILQKPERACRLAENSFDEAIAELPHVNEMYYEDSMAVMQLLKDNLKLWTAAENDGKPISNKP